MTSVSLQTSARRSGHSKVATNVIRTLAVLAALLLAAAVEVAARSYSDPQGQFDATQIYVAP